MLELIVDVKERGLPIILVSHNLPHVFEVADRLHIHRLGRRLCERAVYVGRGGDDDRGNGSAGRKAGPAGWVRLTLAAPIASRACLWCCARYAIVEYWRSDALPAAKRGTPAC